VEKVDHHRLRQSERYSVSLRVLLVALGLTLAAYDLPNASENWPPLPSKAFIKGRAATKADVDRGRAVFILDDGGKIVGRPIEMTIPQYGYFKDDRVFVIVIQAEKAPDGRRFIGAKTFDGKTMVGLLDGLELLGTKMRLAK
jgi:hypothetical protein